MSCRQIQGCIAVALLLIAGMVSAATAPAGKSVRTSAAASGVMFSAQFGGATFQAEGLAAPLATTFEVIEYQDGSDLNLRKRPGRQRFDQVRLRIGVFSQSHGLFAHWREVEQGQTPRGELSLTWTDVRGRNSQQVRFVNAWVSGVEIDTTGSAIITLTHEGMQIATR